MSALCGVGSALTIGKQYFSRDFGDAHASGFDVALADWAGVAELSADFRGLVVVQSVKRPLDQTRRRTQ
jgi:hypothetical protein